ncbi:MAG: DUF116 domain-containing protein [Spirochaetia bacterium]|nr:DUF116 domain-containing protein [Spirochaetia bacterium]
MTEENKQTTEEKQDLIDRRLGDEWAEWSGDISNYEKEIMAGKRIFLGFYFVSLLVLTAMSMGVFYMIEPRLYMISRLLDTIVLILVATVFTIIYIWSFLLLLTIATDHNFIFVKRSEGLHVEWIYPFVYAIAGFFGISKDRVAHSLLKVNNALIFATKKKFRASNLLVLLPRCLDRDTRAKLMDITNKYGCHVFTATGGTSARQTVKKIRPDAIIGVACERDLVSGICDSPNMIPIVAITNMRPHGPCKDTFIDVDKFETAIRFLSKKEIT